jgi:hypothetical protein
VITQDKNHIPWNKYHIPSPRKPHGSSRQSYRSLTGKHQRHSERITCKRPLQCCCGLVREIWNLFTQEYHIPWGQRPRGIWYSWRNTFSYFLNLHAINVLLYRMKPRKHIHVKAIFCLFSLGHCIVWSPLIYNLLIWYIQTIPKSLTKVI